MRSSVPFYDAIAREYDTDFMNVPHRRAYDKLAWDIVANLLPGWSSMIVDAGCGPGLWSSRLLDMGHRVIGIEQSAGMVSILKEKDFGPRFALRHESMESADIPLGSVDAVLAMGSLQYTTDPAKTIARFAQWTKPGGLVAVLVDSYVSLILELLREGKVREAIERKNSRKALWRHGGMEAEYHLLDRKTLEWHFAEAGLGQIQSKGLLITYNAWGRPKIAENMDGDADAFLELETELNQSAELADSGKQLLVYATKK